MGAVHADVRVNSDFVYVHYNSVINVAQIQLYIETNVSCKGNVKETSGRRRQKINADS
jgi:hypothetical protein